MPAQISSLQAGSVYLCTSPHTLGVGLALLLLLSPSAASAQALSSFSLLFLPDSGFQGLCLSLCPLYWSDKEMGRTPPCSCLGSVQSKALLVSELSTSSPSSLPRLTIEPGQGWVGDRPTNQAQIMPVSILLHHAIPMPQAAHTQSP